MLAVILLISLCDMWRKSKFDYFGILTSLILLAAATYLKGTWRYQDELKQLLARHFTGLICDARGLLYLGSRTYDSEPTDVWIATLGRSGTMFVLNMLHQMRTGGDEEFEGVEFLGRFFIPMAGLGRERLSWPQYGAPPRLYFAHGMPSQAPESNYVIYIQRDPEMILQSWYLFQKQMNGLEKTTIEEFYFNCVRKHCIFPENTIPHSIVQWYEKGKTGEILTIRFEDFRKSDEATLKLAKKLQQYLKDIPSMQRELEPLMDKMSFDFSQKRPDLFDLRSYNDYLDEAVDVCLSYRADLHVNRKYRGIKSRKELNMTFDVTPNVKNHIQYTWSKIIEPAIGFANYDAMMKSCKNSID